MAGADPRGQLGRRRREPRVMYRITGMVCAAPTWCSLAEPLRAAEPVRVSGPEK